MGRINRNCKNSRMIVDINTGLRNINRAVPKKCPALLLFSAEKLGTVCISGGYWEMV